MTSRQANIQEDTHFRIMRILQENPDLTQRELAEKLGMSVGGLNYCLNALIDKGLVKMQNFSNSKNKFKYRCSCGPGRRISPARTLPNDGPRSREPPRACCIRRCVAAAQTDR